MIGELDRNHYDPCVMPVLERPTFHPSRKRPTVVTAEVLELLSRNFARLAVKLRSARHVEPRREYLSFVDTVAILHDRAALESLSASTADVAEGRLNDWHDVREGLDIGKAAPDGNGED